MVWGQDPWGQTPVGPGSCWADASCHFCSSGVQARCAGVRACGGRVRVRGLRAPMSFLFLRVGSRPSVRACGGWCPGPVCLRGAGTSPVCVHVGGGDRSHVHACGGRAQARRQAGRTRREAGRDVCRRGTCSPQRGGSELCFRFSQERGCPRVGHGAQGGGPGPALSLCPSQDLGIT